MYKRFSWPLTSTRIPQIGFVKTIDKHLGLQSGLHQSLIWMLGKVWMEPVGTVSLTLSGWDNLCLVGLMPVLMQRGKWWGLDTWRCRRPVGIGRDCLGAWVVS